MVFAKRHRHVSPDEENSVHYQESNPWANAKRRLHPPAPLTHISVSERRKLFEDPTSHSRDSNPLTAFLPPSQASFSRAAQPPTSSSSASSAQAYPSTLSTKLHNRELKPPLDVLNPPPLVGLPLPLPSSTREDPEQLGCSRGHSPSASDSSSSSYQSSTSQRDTTYTSPSEGQSVSSGHSTPDTEDNNTETIPENEQVHLFPQVHRFSVAKPMRHSVRVPNPGGGSVASEIFQRMSIGRPDPLSESIAPPIELLPESSAFLDFNDDDRLTALNAVGNTQTEDMARLSSDNRDSSDTFASLPNRCESRKSLEAHSPRISSSPHGHEKPMFPELSEPKPLSIPPTSLDQSNEDDDGGLDVPARISANPAAGLALRDLQRASVTAANELSNSIRLMSEQDNVRHPEAHSEARTHSSNHPGGSVTCGSDRETQRQGQLFLRTRLFRRWNMRYATIVNQAYFGPVLILFRPDSKQLLQSSVSLKNSKMIALVHSSVSSVDKPRKHGNNMLFVFEVTTSQRTYVFACTGVKQREYWMSQLMP